MKKLFAITTLLALTATSAFAATTGTLLLTGNVPQNLSLTVTGAGVASALDLTTTQSNLVVGSVNVKSNSKTGYKLTIKSAHQGKLQRTDGDEVFGYTLKYGTLDVGLSTTDGSVLVFNSAPINPVNINTNLIVAYTGVASELMVEGTYQDTLTLTLAAN